MMSNASTSRRFGRLSPSFAKRALVQWSSSARRRSLRAAAVVASLGGAMGCGGYAITATSGAVFADSGDAQGQLMSALRASATRDLDCSNGLEVRRLDAERQYEVLGCGARALYDVETPTIRTRHLALVSSERPGVAGARVAVIGSGASRPDALSASVDRSHPPTAVAQASKL